MKSVGAAVAAAALAAGAPAPAAALEAIAVAAREKGAEGPVARAWERALRQAARGRPGYRVATGDVARVRARPTLGCGEADLACLAEEVARALDVRWVLLAELALGRRAGELRLAAHAYDSASRRFVRSVVSNVARGARPRAVRAEARRIARDLLPTRPGTSGPALVGALEVPGARLGDLDPRAALDHSRDRATAPALEALQIDVRGPARAPLDATCSQNGGAPPEDGATGPSRCTARSVADTFAWRLAAEDGVGAYWLLDTRAPAAGSVAVSARLRRRSPSVIATVRF